MVIPLRLGNFSNASVLKYSFCIQHLQKHSSAARHELVKCCVG